MVRRLAFGVALGRDSVARAIQCTNRFCSRPLVGKRGGSGNSDRPAPFGAIFLRAGLDGVAAPLGTHLSSPSLPAERTGAFDGRSFSNQALLSFTRWLGALGRQRHLTDFRLL